MAVGAVAAARFGLEARVACNCGTWEPGAVVGHDYTDERLDGQVYPYQVRLDDGRLFCVPADDVRAPAPCLQSATCLLTSPVCALQDRSIRVPEVAKDGDDEDDDDDDDSSDDDDDEEENEAERKHLFVSEVPDGKHLCILIPAKGTKRKQDDEEKDEKEDTPEEGKGEAEDPSKPKGEEE